MPCVDPRREEFAVSSNPESAAASASSTTREYEAVSRRLDLAIEAARVAGECTLHYFNRPDRLEIEEKSDASVVTNADREAEEKIRGMITQAFPADAIIGEEWGESAGDASANHENSVNSFRWILDPIDGTLSYVHGVPTYGTLIAVECNGHYEIGVVALPGLHEIAWAARGCGAHHEAPHTDGATVPAHVSQKSSLAECTICTTSIQNFNQMNERGVFLAVAEAARHFQGWSDSYYYVLLATGRIDGMIEPTVKLWDLAAPLVVAREAGGLLTDWDGVETPSGGNAIATNGLIHQEFLDLVRRTRA
ncbi:inositol monophosphatase [Candidatus Peregrinibacteria bacterium]|nr:inositol monophosphatase [Candidatus Peregrinibacteria bacterium]